SSRDKSKNVSPDFSSTGSSPFQPFATISFCSVQFLERMQFIIIILPCDQLLDNSLDFIILPIFGLIKTPQSLANLPDSPCDEPGQIAQISSNGWLAAWPP